MLVNIERIWILRNDLGYNDNIGILIDKYDNICKDIIVIFSELENYLRSLLICLNKVIFYGDIFFKCLEVVKEIMKMLMDFE